jgi:2-hydroxy-3-oxopropionate reductase
VSTDTSVSAVSVGVIGLGLMGKPMALNLLKAGFPVTVFNRSQPAIDELAAAGARAAASPAEVGKASDIVITMLPDAPDVESVVLGENGVMAGAKPGVLVIDMSTIAAAAARRIGGQVAARGGSMLDAPVSGGDVGAKAGTLSIMAGGTAQDFERAKGVFAAMGKTVTYCGPAGAGQLVKACNQIMVALVLEAISETLILAEKVGIGPEVLVPVLQGGIANTRIMELRAAKMAAHTYQPGFKAAHHLKDLRIVIATAKEQGITLPVTTQVEQMFTKLIERGHGNLDNSSVKMIVEEMSA